MTAIDDAALRSELRNLITECRDLEKQLPISQMVAGKILLFPKVLGSLELLMRRESIGDDVAMSRGKLRSAVHDFSALLFEIQKEIEEMTMGQRQKVRLIQGLRSVHVAADELENLVKERRKG